MDDDSQIELDDVAPEGDEPKEPAEALPSAKRGRRFLRGVVLGALAGAGSAFILGKPAGEPSAGQDGPQDAPGGSSDGLLGSMRSRWREAASEARIAAREAEQKKRARFLELTDLDERR